MGDDGSGDLPREGNGDGRKLPRVEVSEMHTRSINSPKIVTSSFFVWFFFLFFFFFSPFLPLIFHLPPDPRRSCSVIYMHNLLHKRFCVCGHGTYLGLVVYVHMY